MDSPDLQLQVILAGLFAIFAYMIWWVMTSTMAERKTHREAPQPPGALPLLGHLHLLRSTNGWPLHRTLATMADRYGPVFMLRLGARRTLVVSSRSAARECFADNDRALASRPRSAAAEHMAYGGANFGFAPYGPYWRALRKISTVELLSSARVASFERVRTMEVNRSIKELYELWEEKGRVPVAVDMKQWLKDLSFAIIVRVVAGQRRCSGAGGDSEEMRRFKRGIGEFFRLLRASVVSDLLPFLGWMDLRGHKKAMKAVARDMDAVLAAWLEEHRRKRASGEHGDDRDFIDLMLSAMDAPEWAALDADTIVKATTLGMILAGDDTTSISMANNLAVLLRNPQVLRKAQEEVDHHVGRHRNVDEADIKNLAYLQAVVKETFRLHPTGELLHPHEAMEDCNIAGFHVPAGTRVLVNAWKLQRDPTAWPDDPNLFKPERFLEGSHADVDVKGRHFELIPFSAGRRMCPGASFALHVMHLTLARLLHGFELGPLPSAGAPVDMGETLVGPTQFEVLLTPRLPPELYR